MIIVALFRNLRPGWISFIYLLGLAILGFTAARFPVVCAIYMLPVVAHQYSKVGFTAGRYKTIIIVFLAISGVALIPAMKHHGSPRLGLDHQHLPFYSCEFISKNQISGNIFNDYNFGGFLLWSSYPELRVFVDGRLEVYSGEVLDDYLKASDGSNWQYVFNKYKVDFVLIRPERELNQFLLDSKQWEIVYFDYHSIIYLPEHFRTDIKRIHCLTPWRNRHPEDFDASIEEGEYLVKNNPLFFGGYKILAFLYYRKQMYEKSNECIQKYLNLYPEGVDNQETQNLLTKLKQQGFNYD